MYVLDLTYNWRGRLEVPSMWILDLKTPDLEKIVVHATCSPDIVTTPT